MLKTDTENTTPHCHGRVPPHVRSRAPVPTKQRGRGLHEPGPDLPRTKKCRSSASSRPPRPLPHPVPCELGIHPHFPAACLPQRNTVVCSGTSLGSAVSVQKRHEGCVNGELAVNQVPNEHVGGHTRTPFLHRSVLPQRTPAGTLPRRTMPEHGQRCQKSATSANARRKKLCETQVAKCRS